MAFNRDIKERPDDGKYGDWSLAQLRRMDVKFAAAMQREISLRRGRPRQARLGKARTLAVAFDLGKE